MAKTFKEFAEACWDTHKQVGTKMKGGKSVPNCVPKNEDNIMAHSITVINLFISTSSLLSFYYASDSLY